MAKAAYDSVLWLEALLVNAEGPYGLPPPQHAQVVAGLERDLRRHRRHAEWADQNLLDCETQNWWDPGLPKPGLPPGEPRHETRESRGRDRYPLRVVHLRAFPPVADQAGEPPKSMKTETRTYDPDGNSVTTNDQGAIIERTRRTDDGSGSVTYVTTDGEGKAAGSFTSVDEGGATITSTADHTVVAKLGVAETVTTSDGTTTTAVHADRNAQVIGGSETTATDPETTTVFRDAAGNITGRAVTVEDHGSATTTLYDAAGKPTGPVTMSRDECVEGTWHRVVYDVSDAGSWIKLEDINAGEPCAAAAGPADVKTRRLPQLVPAGAAAIVILLLGGIAVYALTGSRVGPSAGTGAVTGQASASPAVSGAQLSASPGASAAATPSAVKGAVSLDPQPNMAQASFSNRRGNCQNAPATYAATFALTIATAPDGVPSLRIDSPPPGDTSSGPFSADRKSVQTRSARSTYDLHVADNLHLRGTTTQPALFPNCTWDIVLTLQGAGLTIK